MKLYVHKINNNYILAVSNIENTQKLNFIFIERINNTDKVLNKYQVDEKDLQSILVDLQIKGWVDAYIPKINIRDSNKKILQTIDQNDLFLT